jgi:hypothetical protein
MSELQRKVSAPLLSLNESQKITRQCDTFSVSKCICDVSMPSEVRNVDDQVWESLIDGRRATTAGTMGVLRAAPMVRLRKLRSLCVCPRKCALLGCTDFGVFFPDARTPFLSFVGGLDSFFCVFVFFHPDHSIHHPDHYFITLTITSSP